MRKEPSQYYEEAGKRVGRAVIGLTGAETKYWKQVQQFKRTGSTVLEYSQLFG